MGTAMLAAAVLDIVFESTTVKSVAANVIGTTPFDGTSPVIPSPTTWASPVAPDSVPSDSPPPKSRMVPQSILRRLLPGEGRPLGAAHRQHEEQDGAGESSHRLRHAGEHGHRERMLAAEEQRQQAGTDPEQDGHAERDHGVPLARLPGAERALPLRDDRFGARNLRDAGAADPVQVDEDDGHEDDGDRHRQQHPLDERDPDAELLADEPDGDDVRRRSDPA